MDEAKFNREVDKTAAWVKSLPTDEEIRAQERERCAKFIESIGGRVRGPIAREIAALLRQNASHDEQDGKVTK